MVPIAKRQAKIKESISCINASANLTWKPRTEKKKKKKNKNYEYFQRQVVISM